MLASVLNSALNIGAAPATIPKSNSGATNSSGSAAQTPGTAATSGTRFDLSPAAQAVVAANAAGTSAPVVATTAPPQSADAGSGNVVPSQTANPAPTSATPTPAPTPEPAPAAAQTTPSAAPAQAAAQNTPQSSAPVQQANAPANPASAPSASTGSLPQSAAIAPAKATEARPAAPASEEERARAMAIKAVTAERLMNLIGQFSSHTKPAQAEETQPADKKTPPPQTLSMTPGQLVRDTLKPMAMAA